MGCASGTSWAPTVDTYRRAEELPAKVREHLAAIGAAPGWVGFEYGPGSFMVLPQHLASSLLGGQAEPRNAGRLISALRMLKSPLEIERIRRSVGAAVAGYRAGLEAAGLAIRAAAGHEDLDGLCVSSPVGRMITPDRAAAWIPWQQRIPYNALKPAW